MRTGIYSVLRVLVALALVILIWYATYYVNPSPLFPQPHNVLYVLIDLILNYDFLSQLALSLYRVLIGFSLGIILGLGIGLAVLLSRLLRDIVYPIIAFIAVTPSFAFIPLLMLWVGLNDFLPITVVTICTGFPLAYTLISSSKSINPDIIDVALTLGANRRVLVFKVILPLALTHIASMLKLEAGHSWRLVFVTEYLAVSNGLGYLMMKAYSMIRVDEIIALIVILGALALALQLIVEKVETLITSRWGMLRRDIWR
ncbi:MAG: ABC transporter permease [Desulfurococcales archaeon ex4484_42]|nr:MAG: ABC transporter permease [Desulfurococcales archaeon ex4484_42]